MYQLALRSAPIHTHYAVQTEAENNGYYFNQV